MRCPALTCLPAGACPGRCPLSGGGPPPLHWRHLPAAESGLRPPAAGHHVLRLSKDVIIVGAGGEIKAAAAGHDDGQLIDGGKSRDTVGGASAPPDTQPT